MKLSELKDKWIKLTQSLNEKGLPLPMVRDPKSQMASVSLTLVFISFNVWLVSVIGKASGLLGGLDADACFNMFIACSALYFGRKFQKDGKKVELSDKESKGE